MAEATGTQLENSQASWKQRILGAFFLAIGLMALVALTRSRKPPERLENAEVPTSVRVLPAIRVPVVIRALGHGFLRPGKTWEAVAQVSGRLITRNPKLEPGAFVEDAAVLLEIDPEDYRLEVEAALAEEASLDAQLELLEREGKSLEEKLVLAQRQLELAQQELDRQAKLLEKSSATRTAFDREQQATVTRSQQVLDLQGNLGLVPSRRANLVAQQRRVATRLARARLDVERSRILSPFPARVSEVMVEQGQYLRQGQVLARLDGVATAEVTALIPRERMRHLAASLARGPALRGLGDLASRLGELSAVVRMELGGESVEWPAKVLRLAEVDPRTRMIGVVVEVVGPYQGVVPGTRPPLMKGMYLEVELSNPLGESKVVIPRVALRGDRVGIVREGRLELRRVKTESLQPRFVVLSGGLAEGEKVVVSELLPAIEGMLLRSEEDPEELAALRRELGDAS